MISTDVDRCSQRAVRTSLQSATYEIETLVGKIYCTFEIQCSFDLLCQGDVRCILTASTTLHESIYSHLLHTFALKYILNNFQEFTYTREVEPWPVIWVVGNCYAFDV